MKDFAFALLVGIGAGSYSSIFLAAPLLAVLKEREPEFQRRRDDLGALAGVSSVGGALAVEAEQVAAQGGIDDQGLVAEEPQRVPTAVTPAASSSASSKRERRRQRRASRPHGRSR